MQPEDQKTQSIILEAGEGRIYNCGTMTAIFKADEFTEAGKGTFLRIPAKTIHNFANKSDGRTGILNFFIPGWF